MKSCLWQQTDDGQWETDCHNAFEFENGNPDENNFHFCCFCGGELIQMQGQDPIE